MTDRQWEGVWLSDTPDEWVSVMKVHRNCPNPVVLAMTIDPYLQNLLNDYEWIQEQNSYREWLVPAKLINKHSTVQIADK